MRNCRISQEFGSDQRVEDSSQPGSKVRQDFLLRGARLTRWSPAADGAAEWREGSKRDSTSPYTGFRWTSFANRESAHKYRERQIQIESKRTGCFRQPCVSLHALPTVSCGRMGSLHKWSWFGKQFAEFEVLQHETCRPCYVAGT